MANKKIFKVLAYYGQEFGSNQFGDMISVTRIYHVTGDTRIHRQTRLYSYSEKRLNKLVGLLGKGNSFGIGWTRKEK